MPRKPKSVYTRIEEKTAQINKLYSGSVVKTKI